MFKKISSIFFDVIIIFAIFITYIVYKDTISLFEYSISGPIANVFLIGVSVTLMTLGERYDLFCLQLLITNLNIICSCFKKEKNVLNDLYLVTNYELCKRDIVLTILCQDYNTNEYMKKIRKCFRSG